MRNQPWRPDTNTRNLCWTPLLRDVFSLHTRLLSESPKNLTHEALAAQVSSWGDCCHCSAHGRARALVFGTQTQNLGIRNDAHVCIILNSLKLSPHHHGELKHSLPLDGKNLHGTSGTWKSTFPSARLWLQFGKNRQTLDMFFSSDETAENRSNRYQSLMQKLDLLERSSIQKHFGFSKACSVLPRKVVTNAQPEFWWGLVISWKTIGFGLFRSFTVCRLSMMHHRNDSGVRLVARQPWWALPNLVTGLMYAQKMLLQQRENYFFEVKWKCSCTYHCDNGPIASTISECSLQWKEAVGNTSASCRNICTSMHVSHTSPHVHA